MNRVMNCLLHGTARLIKHLYLFIMLSTLSICQGHLYLQIGQDGHDGRSQEATDGNGRHHGNSNMPLDGSTYPRKEMLLALIHQSTAT